MEIAELYEVLEERGIDPVHWDEMRETIENGDFLDADTDAEPVSIETEEIDQRLVETRTYADHSVAIVEIDGSDATEFIDGEGATTQSHGTERCYTQAGRPSTITGCRIYYNGISFSYSYRVDSTHTGSNPHRFTAARGGTVHRALGHSVSLLDTGEVFSSDPRMARFNFTISPLNIGSTRNVWLQASTNSSNGSIGVSTNL